ncbi:MAG: hypothetical protein KBD43_11620 [Saprospiraceae bacterium]|nr:hypothetical protein [Saprospiraceae bacterium]
MKEYLELSKFYNEQGKPQDYKGLLERPEIQTIITTLGKELASIFLCILHLEFKPDTALLDRLVRYKKENRLRDLETAMLKFKELEFHINASLIHTLCARSGKDSSFIPWVKLLNVARGGCLLNPLNNNITDETLSLLNIKKISLYEKLIAIGALDQHVLKNASYSSMPTSGVRYSRDDKIKIDACVSVYHYAKLYHCTEELNATSDKIDILGKWEIVSVKKHLDNLSQKQRLTKETLILALKVRYGLECLGDILDWLEEHHINTIAFCQQFSMQKSSPSLSDIEKIFTLLKRYDLTIINNELVQWIVSLGNKSMFLLKSLWYLEQRSCCSAQCFVFLKEYYERQRLADLNAALERASKKQRSSYSLGVFSSKKNEPEKFFEVASVIFSLSKSSLLEDISAWTFDGGNQWISEVFTPKRGGFIEQLFQLGELNQHAIYLMRMVQFDSICCDYLIDLAKLHAPFPHTLPEEKPSLYLQSLVFLYEISRIIPPLLKNFAFENAETFLKILNRFDNIAYQAFTLNDIENLINVCQLSDSQFDRLGEKIICVLLNWPIEIADVMRIAEKKSDICFKSLKRIIDSGIDISPTSENHFIFPDFYASNDYMLEASTIIALASAQVLSQEIWTLVFPLTVSIKLSIPNMIQRLSKRGQCSFESLRTILSTNNSVLALELWLLLTGASLSVSKYWAILIAHAHPLLLCRGLIELHTRQINTTEHFSKIAQSKQPLLAVSALAQLLFSGIPLESCWDEISQAENPEECAQIVLGSATPTRLNEDLPLELKLIIAHHQQPKLARQYVTMLSSIPNLQTKSIAVILAHQDSAIIVQALLQLSELTPLNNELIEIMIHKPEMLDVIKEYLHIGKTSDNLFAQLCQTSSVQEAEQLLEREAIVAKYPHLSTILRESMSDSTKHGSFIEAINLLESIDEVNQVSIEYLADSGRPSERAEMMVALKKAGLYTKAKLDLAIVRENLEKGVFSTLYRLAEKESLNGMMFDFVMINHKSDVVKSAKHLMDMPEVTTAHMNWLATYPNEQWHNSAVIIIDKLHDAGLLQRYWIEKMMVQTAEPSLSDIANQLQYIWAKLLDESLLEKIFTTDGICYMSDNEEYYNPFEKFSENRQTITKEVIHLILEQPYGESFTVYYNMERLSNAGMFVREIIPYCKTEQLTNAIIQLKHCDQWNEINKAILLASKHPKDDAALMLTLVEQEKYSSSIAELLLSRVEFIRINCEAKRLSAGQYASYFSRVINDLLTRMPLIKETTIELLLGAYMDWDALNSVLEKLHEDDITDDCICMITSMDIYYLKVYINYIYHAFEKDKCRFSSLLKLSKFDPYLNQPSLLKNIEEAASYDTRKKALDTTGMQQLLVDIWELCATGDMEAVSNRILTAETYASSVSLGFRK